VSCEEFAPRPVSQRRGALGGPDDVREENGREDAIGLGRSPVTRHELLDLVDDRV
jgi:hypothetical protein